MSRIFSMPGIDSIVDQCEEELHLNDFSEVPILKLLRIDVRECAYEIERDVAAALLAPPEGIYLPDRIEPVMRPSDSYYQLQREGKSFVRKEIKSLSDITSAVYDRFDKMVVPSYYASDTSKLLSMPNMPYRGIKLAQIAVNEQIANFICYQRYREDFRSKYLKHFVDMDKEDEDHILDCINFRYDRLAIEISSFLGNDVWNHYFVRFRNSLLSLEQGIDYRIHEWMKEHGHKYK